MQVALEFFACKWDNCTNLLVLSIFKPIRFLTLLHCLVLSSLFQLRVVAQTPTLDSLFNISEQNRDVAWELEVLNASWEIMYSQPRLVLKHLAEAQQFAEKQDHDSLISRFIVIRGIAYDVLNEPDSALSLYREGYLLALEQSDSEMQASALNNIGLLHWNENRLDSALDYYQKSEVIFSALGDDSGLMSTQNNIGLIYLDGNRAEDAFDYFQKVLNKSKDGNSEYFESTAYQNLGISYAARSENDSAIFYLQKSIQIQEKIDNLWGLAKSYHSISSSYIDLGKMDLAIEAEENAIEINRGLNNKHGLASNFYQLADPYKIFEDYITASAYLDSARKYVTEVHNPELKQKIIEAKVKFFLLQKAPDMATEFNIETSLKDSLNNEKINGRILEMMEKYESEQKEKQIRFQELEIEVQKGKNRSQLIIAIVAGILVIGLGIWIIARQRYRRKIESLEFQHRMQDEKHRISRDLHDNVGAQLTSIAARLDFMSYDNDAAQETSELNKVSNEARQTIDLLRDTIWALNKEGYSSADFLNRVKAYARRYFGENIELSMKSIGKTIQLNPTEALNLFRIVQEAFQNILKHAEADKVEVSFNGDDWKLQIKDNGKGFSSSDSLEDHYGLQNMKDRAEDIELSIELISKLGNGTCILVQGRK